MADATVAQLTSVDPAPAQTWNWLKINSGTLEVPLSDALASMDGHQLAQLADTQVPPEAQGLLLGVGTQATGWIDGDATSRQVVRVGAGETLDEPVTILCEAAQGDRVQTTVVLEEDSSCQIVALALGKETDKGTSGQALRIVAEPGAKATVYLLIAQGDNQQHIDGVGALLGEDATLDIHHYILGSQSSATGVFVDLVGQNASLNATLSYVGRANQTVDMAYQVLHHGRRTSTLIGANGVLLGNAHKTLRATIDLSRGCKGAEGTETETVLLAGDQVVNKTLPTILCSEDDVAGNHGATIGSLSAEQAFSLACRGLSAADANDLMAEAIVDAAAAALPPQASEAVIAWAQDNLGDEGAENARAAAQLAREF